jgi:hypothetical protein
MDYENIETLAGENARRARANQSNFVITRSKGYKPRPYTPQFSTPATIAVRRLAWAMDCQMTQAIDKMIRLLPEVFDSGIVCRRCKDSSKCQSCVFNTILTEKQKEKLTAL